VSVDILYLLIPLSVVLVIPVGLAFWWALRCGQFDDLDGPAHHVLMDDDVQDAPPNVATLDLDQIFRPPRP
jgi:cbb3-type cytochrome oxidase maturation protein